MDMRWLGTGGMDEADDSESVTGGLLKGDEMTLAGLDEVDDLRSSSAIHIPAD